MYTMGTERPKEQLVWNQASGPSYPRSFSIHTEPKKCVQLLTLISQSRQAAVEIVSHHLFLPIFHIPVAVIRKKITYTLYDS